MHKILAALRFRSMFKLFGEPNKVSILTYTLCLGTIVDDVYFEGLAMLPHKVTIVFREARRQQLRVYEHK